MHMQPRPLNAAEEIAADVALEVAAYSVFIYDEKRLCARLCLLVKTIGLAFYTTTISMCDFKRMDARIVFLLACVFASTLASVCISLRYEYALYLKYGTAFAAVSEFNTWKATQRAGLTTATGIEVCMKIIFLIFSLPIEISFYDNETETISLCEIGKSLLKIHVLGLLVMYALALTFTAFAFISFIMSSNRMPLQPEQPRLHPQPQPQHQHQHQLQMQRRPIRLQLPVPGGESGVVYPQTECCICLDKTDQAWITMPCAHSFHYTCISEWVAHSPSCPVCRYQYQLLDL